MSHMNAQASGRLSLLAMTGPQRLLESGALLNTTAFFAVMPFAPLYLAAHTGLSEAAIGAVVGALYLIGAFGMVGGYLVDRFGATRIMQFGLAADALIYALLIVVRQPVLIAALFIALGPARVLSEPPSKQLLTLAANGDGRVFRRRYMTICLGAVIGPAVSSVLYPISPIAFFIVPASLYVAFSVVVIVRRKTLLDLETAPTTGAAEPAGSWRTVIRDRRLQCVIAGGMLLFLVFSQLETMIPLYMRTRFGNRTEAYFAVLFILNAVIAVAMQVPIDKISAKLNRKLLLWVGSASFTAAFGLFWAGSLCWPLLYVAVVFWTIGEGTLVPLPDMLVHEIAVDGRKGMYFGLADAKQFGFFAGPVLGGLLLTGGAAGYFIVMGLLVFTCVPFLIRAAAPATGAGVAPVVGAGVEASAGADVGPSAGADVAPGASVGVGVASAEVEAATV
jgi:MFS family permease